MSVLERLEEDVRRTCYASSPSDLLGGRLKDSPDDFHVTEVMPYHPIGEGEHVYVELTRSGFTTQQVGKMLANALGVRMREIGWAGLKDKEAVATQSFSVRLGVSADLAEVERRIADATPFRVLHVARHRNKIKRGHVACNRFMIRLRECAADLSTAERIRDTILRRGVPNYYGMQRFGRTFSNLAKAYASLGESSQSRKDVFTTSVLQSALFNVWLTERMESDTFDAILLGDVAKKVDSGGLFVVTDLETDSARFDNGEITYTGPMFGYEMMRAEADAGRVEDDILARYQIDLSAFRENKAPGTRRPAVLRLEELTIEDCGEGDLQFSFNLPAGAYATTVMREFTKNGPKPLT